MMQVKSSLRQQTLHKGSSNTAGRNGKHQQLLPVISNIIPKKPIRPLTAYHIFFQIEREYIIQTAPAGEDDDTSIHDNKVYLSSVPQRYRDVKLPPDWYAGPGKRQKRKHRKQHGKISFLELSRVISSRWAQLEHVDPETKRFVQRIAKQEIDIYYDEMKHYKELTNDLMPQAPTYTIPLKNPTCTIPLKKARKRRGKNSTLSVKQAPSIATAVSSEMDTSEVTSVFESDIDIAVFFGYIDNTTKQLVPPSSGATNQIERKRKMFHRQDSPLSFSCFHSLTKGSNLVEKPSKKQCVGNNVSYTSPVTVEVDISDEEILRMWRSHNN